MKKLARKLSVFALSSITLLSNSHIEAGMFAEGQTYDLGTAGKITLENYNKISDDSEYFEFIKDNNKVCVEVGTDGYEVTVYSSDGRQLFHTYEKKEYITKDFVLKALAIILTEWVESNKNKTLKLSQTQKAPKRTTATENVTMGLSCIAQRTRKQIRVQMDEKRASATNESNKHVKETKPKKEVVEPTYKKITRSLLDRYLFEKPTKARSLRRPCTEIND